MEKARYLPEAQNDFVWAVITTGSPWPLLAGYLLLINLCTFAAFGIDKWKARHPGRRRIPERNLFLGAIAAGNACLSPQDAPPLLPHRHSADPGGADPDLRRAVPVLECDPIKAVHAGFATAVRCRS